MQLDIGRKRLCSSSDEEQENAESGQCARQRQCCSQGPGVAEAQRWMEAHNLMALAAQPLGPLPPSFWLALAELNISLSAFQFCFQDLKLLDQQTFTRCPKALAFEKLAFSRGCRDMWSLQQQPHLQAVSLLLETALAGCTEAAISQATLLCPPFLAAWAARWMPAGGAGDGHGDRPPPRLRLLIIQGYRQTSGPLRAATCYNLGLPTVCGTPAAATIYIPCPQ